MFPFNLKQELKEQPQHELAELTAIYVSRGLDQPLARTVAEKLMAKDALGAHARDELGITEELKPRPIQAALTSAVSFSAGALVPIITVLLVPSSHIEISSFITALITLLVLGALAAYAGGASLIRGALRVFFWGAFAMGVTAGVGKIFGTSL